MSKSNAQASNDAPSCTWRVAGHEQVEVHDVARRDRERGLEVAIPGVVVDGRVEDMLGHRSSSQ